jgi:23S rRNA (pseudouridine1915-N3)-methyltransferase
MKLSVMVVGDDAKDPFRILGDAYLQKTSRLLTPQLKIIHEVKRKSKASSLKAAEEEAFLLLKASTGFWRIALDSTGKNQTSIQFAHVLERRLLQKKTIAFLIGGASGLSPSVLSQSNEIWSLSQMTFPHRLAYCILAEQIYRTGEILRNGPYHK